MLRLRLFVFEVYIDCPLLSTTSGREKFSNSTETEHLPGLAEGVFQALGTHLTNPDDSKGYPVGPSSCCAFSKVARSHLQGKDASECEDDHPGNHSRTIEIRSLGLAQ
jgi:hypothetical protein